MLAYWPEERYLDVLARLMALHLGQSPLCPCTKLRVHRVEVN